MLELAIAEAYRPRPGPLKPAIPRAQAPTTGPRAAVHASKSRRSSVSWSSKLSEASSKPSSVAGVARGVIALFKMRGRRGEIASGGDDAVRADSLFSTTSAMCAVSAMVSARGLPVLPPPVPLPLQDDLAYFDGALDECVAAVRCKLLRPGTDLGRAVLEDVAHISDLACCVATSWPEFFAMLIHALTLIVSVLPAADVGGRTALVQCVARIAGRWNEAAALSTGGLAVIVGGVINSAVYSRSTIDKRLGREFAQWMGACIHNSKRRSGKTMRILTLGVSTALLAALEHLLASDAGLEIRLSVLSSLNREVPAPPLYARLHITAYSIGAVGTASREVDILLLEPTCIGPSGDVRCQNGALGTAVCVKMLSKHAKVVVLSGVDNVATSVMERRITGDAADGLEETLELVSANFVDVYVSDRGALEVEDLKSLADEAEELDQHILGECGLR